MLIAKFHEVVLQILFALENGGDESVIELVMAEAKISRQNAKQAYARAQAIWQQKETWDAIIGKASNDYSLERIPTVEKNILRYALMEISEENDRALIAKETVRLARKFSTPEAGAFVHAILHTISPLPPLSEEGAS
ncbi:MAG: hypothetical protein JSS62_04960 [Verrucomicrobia bacterium]|nr:hypothetical protein [Verrucomicrobiota bacterium]MBS0647501.1 hypothetical protein [Verrucomicrobiota bacterium]